MAQFQYTPPPCRICGEPGYAAEARCRKHWEELRASVDAHGDGPVKDPLDAAKRFIRYYVYRGDDEKFLHHMGHYGSDYRISIGGYAGGKWYPATKIVVMSVNDQPCEAVFDLHRLYEELKAEQSGQWQPALFS